MEYPNEPSPASCPVEAVYLEDGPAAKHIFTHREWHMTSIVVEAAGADLPKGWIWAGQDELRMEYAVPNAFRGFEELVEARLNP